MSMRISLSKRKPVYGVGINDADYIVSSNKRDKRYCPAYSAWMAILTRIYGKDAAELSPTYQDVEVCKEWLKFSGFRGWWEENHVDGWHIDKDIVGGGKLYSPESCIYVPPWINTFNSDVNSKRGRYMIGVNKINRKFRANCRHPFKTDGRHLGYFSTESEAHSAWKRRKLEIAAELKHLMDEVDERIYPSIVRTVNQK